jgi:hypothetical protein
MPPNKPLELTPLCVEQDPRDFESWFRLNAFPFYRGGAAQRHGVGRHLDGTRSRSCRRFDGDAFEWHLVLA